MINVLLRARSAPDDFVGKHMSPARFSRMSAKDNGETPTNYQPSGHPNVDAFSRSGVSGWTVVSAFPRRRSWPSSGNGYGG